MITNMPPPTQQTYDFINSKIPRLKKHIIFINWVGIALNVFAIGLFFFSLIPWFAMVLIFAFGFLLHQGIVDTANMHINLLCQYRRDLDRDEVEELYDFETKPPSY